MIVGAAPAEKAGLRRSIATLLAAHRFGVLATRGGTAPHLSLVAFAVTEDLESIVFATERATQKYANLRTHSGVAVLFDNRSELGDNLDLGVAVTATGRTEELCGGSRAEFERLLLDRHPYMAGFVASKTCALMRLRVDNYSHVRGLSNVRQLHVSPTRSATSARGEGE